MSAIFDRLMKVSVTNFTLHRARFSPSPSRHFFLHRHHRVKWFHNYIHGIPGIPNDGKVVRLTNSITGSEIYLVGTCHISPQSAETVKKVINSVRPDAVAIELCKRRAMALRNWKPEDDNLYRMFRLCMRVPGGLCIKIRMFMINFRYRQLRACGIFPGQEFKVAMEESLRVKARCFAIDQDIGVMRNQLSKLYSFDLLRRSLIRLWDLTEKLELHQFEQYWSHCTNIYSGDYTRSTVRELMGLNKKIIPELFKVYVEDRDKLMLSRLRSIEGKVVAVVGLGHMDGIELLWKLAEDAVNKQPPTTSGGACQ